MPYLLRRRHGAVFRLSGNTRFLFRKAKIRNVWKVDFLLIPRLAGQPFEKSLEVIERGQQSGLAECRAAALAFLAGEVPLEGNHLFAVEGGEILEIGILLIPE